MNFNEVSVQDAVLRSIQTEKNAMDFYRLGAGKMSDREAVRVFELLAREERDHAGSFYKVYTGTAIPSLDEFLDQPPQSESDWLASLNRLIGHDFNEQKAMELAMSKEQQLEEALKNMAGQIADPDVKAVFEMNARETHNHYVMIESEYARLMGMVHESDMDIFVRE
jgi:rubrerythrin